MKKNFFTIPNILTLCRIILIPVLVIIFFIYYDTAPYLPAIIFAVAAFTDLLDGFIAKKFNMISDMGKLLDPLADKLFFNTMLLCFVIKTGDTMLTILLMINVLKEVYLVTAGTLLYRRKFILPSKFIGKAATFVLNLGVIIYFFAPYLSALKIVSNVLFISGLVLSVSAAVYYSVTVYKQTGGKLPPKTDKGEQD